MSFDWQPILKGDLIELRPLRPEDHADLYVVASDPLMWEQHPDKTRYEVAGFRVFFDEALASGGALVAIDVVTQRVIGSLRFHGYDPERDEVEIGWTFLARSHWGGRYNSEMKRLMLQHAFQFVSRVVFLIGPQNLRSQRAVEKSAGCLPAPGLAPAAGKATFIKSKDDRRGTPVILIAAILLLALPVAFGIIRVVDTGDDVRYLWLAGAAIVGSLAVVMPFSPVSPPLLFRCP